MCHDTMSYTCIDDTMTYSTRIQYDILTLTTSSYFTDRTQSFVLGDSTTDAYTVDCSVPQGSVLGPLSFVAYTDDIGDVVERQHGV